MPKFEIVTTSDELHVRFISETVHQLIPSHWHPDIEVLYIINGSMDVVMSNTKCTLGKKDMMVVNSGIIHMTVTNEPTTYILLQFPFELLQQSMPEMKQIRFRDIFVYEVYKDNSAYMEMVDALSQMASTYQFKAFGYPFQFNSYMQKFIYHLVANFTISTEQYETALDDKHRKYLQIATEYIEMHYNEPITLKQISNHLALTPEYFCRIFKAHMGFTFLEYVNHIRLTQIYNDLMKTNDSVTRIQERHGFTNYRVFSRMFKETYGCTPSMVRKDDLFKGIDYHLVPKRITD